MIQNEEHERALKDVIKTRNNGSTRIFKLNSGMGWTGNKTVNGPAKNINLYPGDVLIRGARMLRAGLCGYDGKPVTGAPDLLGFSVVEVTPDMVGQKVAKLELIEVKTGKGKLNNNQKSFHKMCSFLGIKIEIYRP